jgi:hypothetical protein
MHFLASELLGEDEGYRSQVEVRVEALMIPFKTGDADVVLEQRFDVDIDHDTRSSTDKAEC